MRKLISSWLIIFLDRTPPSIGMNCTFWVVVVPGLVTFLVDLHGLMVGGAGVVGASMRRRFPILIIWGVLPGMLWRVSRECVLAFLFNVL